LISLDVGRFLLPVVLCRLTPEDLFDLFDEWAGAREPRQIYNSTQQEKVTFVDVVGIEASKAELLEIVARIKLHRSFN
jgi:hypothetical protein